MAYANRGLDTHASHEAWMFQMGEAPSGTAKKSAATCRKSGNPEPAQSRDSA